MSRNSKNARLQKLAKEMPKNRSAAARERAKSGEQRKPGRASAPKHSKKNCWWQKFRSYSEFIKGGGKKPRRGEAANDGEVQLAA